MSGSIGKVRCLTCRRCPSVPQVRASLAVEPVSARVKILSEGVTRITLHGQASAELVGRVFWEDGTPAEGVMVEIDPPVAESSLRRTDASGSYRYFSIAGGREEVRVDAAAGPLSAALSRLWTECPALRDRVITELGEVRPHVNIFVDGDDIRAYSLTPTRPRRESVLWGHTQPRQALGAGWFRRPAPALARAAAPVAAS